MINNLSEAISLKPVLSSTEQTWSNIDVMQFRHKFNELTVPPFSCYVITIHLGCPINLVERINGRVYSECLSKGSVTLIPPGLSSEWRWKEPKGVDILHLYLKDTFVQEVAMANDVNLDRSEILNNLGVRDPQIEYIGLAMKSEIEAGCLAGRLYGESLAIALAVHLLRRYSVFRSPLRDYTGGLPKYKLRQVTKYINDNLEKDLTLANLADFVQMSPYHFARLFKQSTGLAPHQYVIQYRVERAKQLLLRGELSVCEIADAVGFYDQSHLHHHFKRLVGVTPRMFYKNNCPAVNQDL